MGLVTVSIGGVSNGVRFALVGTGGVADGVRFALVGTGGVADGVGLVSRGVADEVDGWGPFSAEFGADGLSWLPVVGGDGEMYAMILFNMGSRGANSLLTASLAASFISGRSCSITFSEIVSDIVTVDAARYCKNEEGGSAVWAFVFSRGRWACVGGE